MRVLELFIVLLCCGFICATDPCLTHSSCQCVLSNHTVIDLSSVGSPEFVRFYDVLFQNECNTTNLFSYNPCFAFDSPDRQIRTESDNIPCSGASACVKTPGGNDGKFPEVHAIGLQKNTTFIMDDTKTKIKIKYTNPGSKGELHVILNCSVSHGDTHILSLDSPNCPTGNEPLIVFTLTSKCACPDGCKTAGPTESPSSSSKGLSTGSILLITFFTIFTAYFLVGVVWNYLNGSHGLQLIPNIEFWDDLPTLIMEGVAFTCSCCGKARTYGEV